MQITFTLYNLKGRILSFSRNYYSLQTASTVEQPHAISYLIEEKNMRHAAQVTYGL